MQDFELKETVLQGISASPGICIGKVYLVDTEGVDVVEKYYINGDDLQNEKNRFKAAVKKSRDELKSIIDDTSAEFRQHTNILEAHMVLIKDKMLYDKILETIESDMVNAEWALKKVVSKLKSMFNEMEDSYFKGRAADIDHVADRIMRNLMGAEKVNIADINTRVILVAHDLSPAETSQIKLERVMGFITDRGGKESHTSIIARSLEIPAVLGLENVTRMVSNDNLVIIDGTAGIVVLHPEDRTLIEFEERKAKYAEHQATLTRASHLPAETLDGHDIQILGNIEYPDEVVSVLDHGGDGIGLYRTEFQYMSRPNFPDEEELFEKYRDVVEIMAPRPVTIRTLDINGDKAVTGSSESKEDNPALGLRAIRYCLHKQDVFIAQLRAILRAAAYGKVRIMFPLISTCEEVMEVKQLLDKAAESLEKDGLAFNREIETGIMMEVPSAVIMADAMAEFVDFFSIGTNDLIQYSLAIDRGNRMVSHYYHSLHPAIIRMIRRVADVARLNNINVSICGEMAGDPMNIPILLGLGINELSIGPQSIPAVKNMIRLLRTEDCKEFMKDVFKKKRASEIEELMQDSFGKIISENIYAG